MRIHRNSIGIQAKTKEKHLKNVTKFVNYMSPVKDGPEHTDGTTSNEEGQYSDSEKARDEKDKNLKVHLNYKSRKQLYGKGVTE